METSALPSLRPLRLGELLDQAVRLYRHNFMTFVGIIALVYIPYALMQIVSSTLLISNLQGVQSNPESILTSPAYWLSILGSLAADFVYIIFVLGLGTAALTNAISRSYMGQKVSILQAYQQLGSLWIKLLVTFLIFALLWIAASIWMLVPFVGWLTGPGLLVFLSFIVGPLIPCAVVIERLEWFQPISRAWDLARRRFWWLLGFAVIFYLFNQLAVSGPTFLINYLAGLAFGSNASMPTAATISTLISTVVVSLIRLVVLPIQITAWTLVYFDLRVRTEGFDLALLTMNSSEHAGADFSSPPAAAPTRKWLTGDDIGKFVVVTLVVIGMVALLFGLLALIGVGLSSFRGF